jgi:hypothetical protein
LNVADFCREIEAYLCRKNDGHLIRVVGPSFAVVSGWAEQGIPLKIACEGIDRYFERYYRSGPRRRPVKVDFCDADVLDAFDEWRRAVGAVRPDGDTPSARADTRRSLPDHLERVVLNLTSARASGRVGPAFDALIDRAAAELDAARSRPGGVRGDARARLIERLAAIDGDMLRAARQHLDGAELTAMMREADEELAPFRGGMTESAYVQAREAALGRILRARLSLPTVGFD